MAVQFRIDGLIPAVFVPLKENGSLNIDMMGPVVDHLVANDATALFVNGSAGEGVSLTVDERKEVAQAAVQAAAGRIPVIVHIGHTSLTESRDLAAHAQKIGADSISAILPSYFKPGNLDLLIQSLQEILQGAPEMPFYYYHIPALMNLSVDVRALLERTADELPSMVGVKYSSVNAYEITWLKNRFGSQYNLLFGVDEMLLSGLVAGADGAVGSTYNFLLPICNQVVRAHAAGDLRAAEQAQRQAAEFIRIGIAHGGLPALKATMQLIGLDCGPVRLPLAKVSAQQVKAMEAALKAAGFFEAIAQKA